MSKKQKNKAKDMLKMMLIFVIVIFIALQVILMSIQNLSKNDEKISDSQVEADKQAQELEKAKEASDKIALQRLGTMTERDRMEYYFSMFLKSVENQNYEKAYDMLYEDFKDNYFPDIDSFITYAKKTFPKMASVEHTNIERSGDIYILFIKISDSLASSKNDAKEMKIIIQENDLNDFVMSFSVI